MKHVCKSVCVLLVLVMFTTPLFAVDRHINIRINEVTNMLEDADHPGTDIRELKTKVKSGDIISWTIVNPSPQFRSITIAPKPNGGTIFTTYPPYTYTIPTGSLTVADIRRAKWRYSIHIEFTGGRNSIDVDPKIAVKPTASFLIFVITVSLTGLVNITLLIANFMFSRRWGKFETYIKEEIKRPKG